jgi:murein L,D-transpeptidase YafK
MLLKGCALIFASLPLVASSAETTVPTMPSQSETAAELFPASLLQISETEAFSKFVLLVDKEKRILTVFERNGEQIKKIQEYPADIGKNGGNKTKRDDARTPEGIYFLEKRMTPPEIPFNLYGVLAFTTNYPNLFDKRENKTGSGIWLHAVPDTVPLTRGSRGCVVVRNEVIKKLADYIKLRETPILIFDHVDYVSKEEHIKRRSEMTEFIEQWRAAWEAGDIEKYMGFYDKDFKAPGFNFGSWRAHKAHLKTTYEYIKVHLSQPYIVAHHDQLMVKTLQRYESDKHVDYGVKTVYAIKFKDGYKIVREEWSPFNQKEVTAAIAKDNSMTAQTNEVQQ